MQNSNRDYKYFIAVFEKNNKQYITGEQHKQNDTNHMIEIAKIDRYQFRQKSSHVKWNDCYLILIEIDLALFQNRQTWIT